jgi:hypothetical protein
MSEVGQKGWTDPDGAYALARLAVVRERLAAYCGAHVDAAGDEAEHTPTVESLEHDADAIAEQSSAPPALDQLCDYFRLSRFERDILVLCMGMELDPYVARLCATANGDLQQAYPTFTLTLHFLPEAHWSAITPDGPLRYWRLVDLDRSDTLTSSQLRIDERILHHLIGDSYLDERLRSFLQPVHLTAKLPASHGVHVERIAGSWGGGEAGWTRINLCGDAIGDRLAVAAASCIVLGLSLYILRVSDIPSAPIERETLLRLWQRESLLLRSALLLESADGDDQVALRHALQFAKRIHGPVFTSGRALAGVDNASLRIEVNRPTMEEQRTLWQVALGEAAEKLNGQLDTLTSQFQLDADGIKGVGAVIRETVSTAKPDQVPETVRHLYRRNLSASLGGLAESIETRAVWDDLVLPDDEYQTLREIAAQVQQRRKVYDSWGFASRSLRGLGISALFAGQSGTGKTLAAEVLANDLKLDLYRIDLSQVVSKYIGETEKNLRTVFDAAEQFDAVLLFDEADALFGKRSEVRDSHDRYANIEVSYLLQRMEAYRGLAILTTNLRGNLDHAFLRRIRFVVTFPFPDATLRSRIWSRIFPPETPTDGLDVNKLSRLNVTGGSIRNIALNAAFLAAGKGQPVGMAHLLHTARGECLKMEKQTTTGEFGGWV